MNCQIMRINTMSKIEEVLYLLKHHKTQRYIADRLSISRNSIRKYETLAKKLGFNDTCDSESIVTIAADVHDKVYEESRTRDKYAQKTLIDFHSKITGLRSCSKITTRQIFRLLKEQGLKNCSEKSLSRYLDKHFPKPLDYTVHIEAEPGIEAQVDYADVGVMFGKKTYVFIMTMSFSRYRYVEFVHTQNIKSWIQSHINAFEFFGAVPHTVMIDNLKSGVIKPDIYDPVLNRSYAELSRHYDFTVDTAKVRRPEHKGKVERSVVIVRQQLIAGRYFDNLADANLFAKRWCSEMISEMECSTTGKTPKELFIQEKPLMLSMNHDRFDICTWHKAKVRRDHHIVIQGNFYSVTTKYIGLELDIRVGFETVKIYLNNRLLKCHLKPSSKGVWVTDHSDYPEHVTKYTKTTVNDLQAKADTIGEFTSSYLKTVMSKPSKICIRKAIRILDLASKYEPSRVESACLRASTFDNYDYKSLKNILDKNLDMKETPTFSTTTTNNAFIRDSSEYEESKPC